MIRFLLGSPGSGKTYRGMKQLIDVLRFTERHVVANVEEIDWPELNMYLQREMKEEAPDLHARLTVIPKAETFAFFRWRAGGLVLPSPPEKDGAGRKLSRQDFLASMLEYFSPVGASKAAAAGVTYFIDETHEYFNAREWADIGRSVLYYASKHRHLDDDVWFLTQAPEQVEATLKRLANEFHVVRNHYRESVGMFRKKGEFWVRSFYSLPGPTSKPYEETTFKLDKDGIGKCYKTTGALGMGGKPETLTRPKKLPFWALPLGLAAAAALGIYLLAKVPSAAAFGLAHAIGGAKTTMEHQVAPRLGMTAPVAEKSVDLAASSPGVQRPAKNDRLDPNREKSAELRVVGVTQRGGLVNVVLSDGRVLSEADEDLMRVERHFIVLRDGRKIYFAQPVERPAAAVPVASAPVPPVVVVPAAAQGDGIERMPPSPPLDFTPHLGLPSPFEHRGP